MKRQYCRAAYTDWVQMFVGRLGNFATRLCEIMCNSFFSPTLVVFAALLGSAAERERVLREHKAIAVAIGARDPDRAERAMRDHVIRSGHQHIRLAFGENGDFKR